MKRPNILMIQVDQQSASALSLYGNKISKTPHIERLAADGAIFENAYTNFPLCAPSRFSMMSGRLATAIEAYDTAAEFRASTPTIAHYLRYLGYQTTLCGKMHFIGPDQLHGFEERLTSEIYPADFGMLPMWETDEAVEYATDAFETLKMATSAPRTVQMDYDEEVTFCAERKLHDYARMNDSRSFFLLVSFTHPHEPYICPPKYWDLYPDESIDMPRVPPISPDLADEHSLRLYKHHNLLGTPISAKHVRNGRHGYYGAMSYVDEKIGRLLDLIDALGFRDNTIVLFTSDHGEMLGERGLWFKKCFFEDAVRIPLVIRTPGIAPRRIKQNVSLVDLLPTLVEMAGPPPAFEFADPIDGNSLMSLVKGDDGAWSDTIYGELTSEGVIEPVVMVKKGSFKYIYSQNVAPMLFELDRDPLELKNLAGRPEAAQIELEFSQLIATKWGDLGALRKRIIASQKSRQFVRDSLSKGRYVSWDYAAGTDSDRYLRHGKSYNQWIYTGVPPTQAVPRD